MRILIVEDHAVVRAGLHQLLTSMIGADVREAPDGEKAWRIIGVLRPDLVILDLALPGQGGLTMLPDLHRAGLRVLVLSMHGEPLYATRALGAGALGYVSKNVGAEELITAVRMVADGKRHIEARIAQEIALQRIGTGDKLHQLSARDIEIMQLLASGCSLSESAARMGISYKTVANTISLIRSKLGVSRTADLIRLALDMRPGTPGPDGSSGVTP